MVAQAWAGCCVTSRPGASRQALGAGRTSAAPPPAPSTPPPAIVARHPAWRSSPALPTCAWRLLTRQPARNVPWGSLQVLRSGVAGVVTQCKEAPIKWAVVALASNSVRATHCAAECMMGIVAMSPAGPPAGVPIGFRGCADRERGRRWAAERMAGVLSVLSPGGHQGWASECGGRYGYQARSEPTEGAPVVYGSCCRRQRQACTRVTAARRPPPAAATRWPHRQPSPKSLPGLCLGQQQSIGHRAGPVRAWWWS